MTTLAPHVSAFFEERLTLERRVSDNTRDSYAYAFKLLLEYAHKRLKVVPSRLELEQIDAPLVVGFLNDLETTRSNGANSRNVRLAAIKSFMHFVEYRVPSALEQIQRVLAIPMKKTDTRLVRHLTAPEIQALLDAPKPIDWAGIRDRAMLHLAFAAGLRVSELTGLRLEDLSLHPHASILVHGKGRKERCLPLWKQTTATLRAWLAVRGAVPVPELFVNARREPMTRAGFEYVLEKYVCLARQQCPSMATKRISPHVLRHSCALRILEATKDIRKVSLWLGHANMQTTEMYTRADPSIKLEALDAVTPPTLRSGRFRATDKLIASLTARSVMRREERSR
jgi:integrase/recombinase XerD